jgi:membrane protein implicated in regulation of membrane protease activity
MTDDYKKGAFINRGLRITLYVVIIGAGMIAVLKAVYPQVSVGQYLTLVTVCSILTAIVLDYFIQRWKNNSEG